MIILSLACRKSCLTYHLCDERDNHLLARGRVDLVSSGDSFLTLEVPGRETYRRQASCPTHHRALESLLGTVANPGHGLLAGLGEIDAVAHHVTQGGERFGHTVPVDPQVVAALKEIAHLAPAHNGAEIAGIEAACALLPATPQGAVFDTAFHQTMPPRAYVYPLPYDLYRTYGIRRYGFHGPVHRFLTRQGAAQLGRKQTDCNLVTVHLGTGVSVCAVKNGTAIDTSTGFTPLEGAMSGTGCGDIDPGIPAFLMNEGVLSPQEMKDALGLQSGLLGVTGRSSERDVVWRAGARGDERCRLAIAMEAYRLRKYLGGYLAALGGADAVIFSGEGGEAQAELRERTLTDLGYFGLHLDAGRNRAAAPAKGACRISRDDSPMQAFVVPAEEDFICAGEVAALFRAPVVGATPADGRESCAC